MPTADPDTHIFSARLPHEEYEALKAYAFFTGTSMNDIVIRAIRAYLVAQAGDQELATAVDAAQQRLRDQLKRWTEP